MSYKKVLIASGLIFLAMFTWAASYHFNQKTMGNFAFYFTAIADGIALPLFIYCLWKAEP